ncbi:hypothetical protein GCM10010215_58250 [Streptomyces virginiae]|nr:hypothetical protein GCM10010215_58250 [Streptomyces virginiae]
MVGVVEEEDEVAEADQGVGAVAGARQGLGVAVHVAHDVDPCAARSARAALPAPHAASHADNPRGAGEDLVVAL